MFKHILGFIFGLLLGIIILLLLRKNKYKGPDSNIVKKKYLSIMINIINLQQKFVSVPFNNIFY